MTDDEIVEEKIVERVVMDYKFKASIFGSIIDAFVQKKSLSANTLTAYLVNTQAFGKCSQELLNVGFERYFAGDYVSCLHILVPQLESTLRWMLFKLGISTTVMDKDSVQEKTLGVIIREPKMTELLGEPAIYYLRSVLEDKRGDNLRNDIAHGLISYENCSKNTANIILHIFILLTRYTFNPTNQEVAPA